MPTLLADLAVPFKYNGLKSRRTKEVFHRPAAKYIVKNFNSFQWRDTPV